MSKMMWIGIAASVIAAVGTLGWLNGTAAFAAESGDKVAHNVFFKLKESNGSNRKKLVDACFKYLVNHSGVEYFACGTVCEDLDREVNDRDWDVGLHIVFHSKADHDTYQTAPDHLKFIEENKETWQKVRVFDSYVRSARPSLSK